MLDEAMQELDGVGSLTPGVKNGDHAHAGTEAGSAELK